MTVGFGLQRKLARLPVQRIQTGNELQIPVRGQRIKYRVGRGGNLLRDNAQDIIRHTVLFQKLCSLQGARVGGSTGSIDTVTVVQGRRAVQRDAHQKLTFGKKLCPFLVQQGSVGLQRIGHGQTTGVVLLLQRQHAPIKRFARKQRFPALKRKADRAVGVGECSAHQRLQGRLAHGAKAGGLAAGGLIQIKAVAAAQVARTGYWLDKQRKIGHGRFSFFMMQRGQHWVGGGQW